MTHLSRFLLANHALRHHAGLQGIVQAQASDMAVCPHTLDTSQVLDLGSNLHVSRHIAGYWPQAVGLDCLSASLNVPCQTSSKHDDHRCKGVMRQPKLQCAVHKTLQASQVQHDQWVRR